MTRKFLTGITAPSATLSGLSTGVVHAAVDGVLTSSTIVNSDVAAGAAIVQSKLATNTAAQWSAGTEYFVGDLAYNLGVTYRRKFAGTTVNAPALDSTNWAVQTAPASSSGGSNTIVIRDGNANIGSSTFSGDVSILNTTIATSTFLGQVDGTINAATSVYAQDGNLYADVNGNKSFPTTSGGGNIVGINQIITSSTATDSIKTSGGVTTGSVTASGNITAASATLTSGFNTNGVVHNNTSGVLSSSLITNVDVATSAGIDISKISGAAAAPLYYQLTSSFSPSSGSPGTTAFSPFGLGTTSTNGITVSNATTYAIDMQVAMFGVGAATAKTLNFTFGSNQTATVSSAAINVTTNINTTQITPAIAATVTYMGTYYQTSGFTFAVEPSRTLAASPFRLISIKGFVRIGGTAGSTSKLIPVLQYATNGETSVTIYAGSTITLTPLPGTTSNGTWS